MLEQCPRCGTWTAEDGCTRCAAKAVPPPPVYANPADLPREYPFIRPRDDDFPAPLASRPEAGPFEK